MKTITVYLGANRSLTTISSAMLALHPRITVLNHAFIRIFEDPANNFLAEPCEARLDHFVDTARDMALGGERGAVGGHILHSHAFGDELLRSAYLDRFGWGAKPESTCLLWKDATRVTNYLIDNGIALDGLARRLPRLRFVMIVRNPVDICISSINKGYSQRLVGEARQNDLGEVFNHMIGLFAWFAEAAAANAGQFRFVYQDELVDPDRLVDLCGFLDVPPDRDWLDEIARLIRLRPSYDIPEVEKERFRGIAHRLIPDALVARRVAEQIV